MNPLFPGGDVLVTLAERKTEIDVLDVNGSRNCTNNNRNNVAGSFGEQSWEAG